MECRAINTIKQIPILEVAKRLGIEVKGKKAICFGGHDTDPSLSFVLAKNIWKCFGCGKKGDAITLVKDVLQLDFKGTLQWFECEFGIKMGTDHGVRLPGRKRFVNKRLAKLPLMQPQLVETEEKFRADPQLYAWFFERCGEVAYPKGVTYMKEHGIPLRVASKFGVRELRNPSRALVGLVRQWGAERVFRSGLTWGDAVPERLIWGSYTLLFPFREHSEVVYIQGRPFSGRAKYLGLRGIHKPLYNSDSLDSLAAGTSVHLCEGVPDALALEAKGLHALAVLGASSFRTEWTDRLFRYDLVLVPDGDSGGRTFLRAVSEAFRKRGKAIRAVQMPENRDAADVLGESGGYE